MAEFGDAGCNWLPHVCLGIDTFRDLFEKIIQHWLKRIDIGLVVVLRHDLDLYRILRKELFEVRVLIEVYRGYNRLLVGVLFKNNTLFVNGEDAELNHITRPEFLACDVL